MLFIPSCRPVKWPFYFGIVAPFVLIFIFNVLIFIVVVWSLLKSTHQRKKLTELKLKMINEYKKLAVIVFTLTILFCFGWAFAFLIPTDLHNDGVVISTVAQYIFSVLVGFHGVLIFILYALRSPEVRQVWKYWFVKYVCCFEPPPQPLTSTRTTTGKPRWLPESESGDSYFLQFGDKQNPVYDSHENVYLEATSSTYVRPVSPERQPMETIVENNLDKSLGSLDALSYASETLLLDFTQAEDQTDDSDEGDEGFTILQELEAQFNIYHPPEDVQFATTSFSYGDNADAVNKELPDGQPVEGEVPNRQPVVAETGVELRNGRRVESINEHELTAI